MDLRVVKYLIVLALYFIRIYVILPNCKGNSDYDRRTAIKQFFIIAGGLTILSSCLNDGGASIVLNKLKISAEDEQFLGDLADILIPKSDTPGGRI